jgi:hypothetical protein
MNSDDQPDDQCMPTSEVWAELTLEQRQCFIHLLEQIAFRLATAQMDSTKADDLSPKNETKDMEKDNR